MKKAIFAVVLVAVSLVMALPVLAASPNLGLVAARVTEAPIIDGVLGDAAWLTASQMGAKIVVDLNSGATAISTFPRVTYIAYDDVNLYIGAIAFCSDSSKLKTNAPKIYNNEEVEFYIQLPGAATYQKMTVAVNGQATPEGGIAGTYAVNIDTVRWSVEIAIPWESVGKIPVAGDVWKFNLAGHAVCDGDFWITWNPTYGKFANPDRFGTITFLP